MDWSKLPPVADWLKSPSLMFLILLVAGVLLVLPRDAAVSLGLQSGIDTMRGWVALAFLTSAAALLTKALFAGVPALWKRRQERSRAAAANLARVHQAAAANLARVQHAHTLSRDEKRVLRMYFRDDTRVERLNLDSGTVAGLIQKGFLTRPTHYGSALGGFPVALTDWAFEYFGEHPELIETPGSEPFGPLEHVP